MIEEHLWWMKGNSSAQEQDKPVESRCDILSGAFLDLNKCEIHIPRACVNVKPPMRSRIPAISIPEASSTARYFPPWRMLPKFNICDNESTRRSRRRFWSFRNQYSQTLYSVGSMVVNNFEYLLWLSRVYNLHVFHSLRFFAFFVFVFAVFRL